MTHKTWEDVCEDIAVQANILDHIHQNGPQTAQGFIDAGLASNADDTVAAMAWHVEGNKARWTEADGVKAIAFR